MTRYIITLFIIFYSTAWAGESLNFDIAKFNYVRPASNIGGAGSFQFNKLSLFYYDFMSEITNEDGRFDAKIFVRNNFLGLSGKQMKLGLYTKDGDILSAIKKADGTGIKIVLNSKKVSMKSNAVRVLSPKLNIVVPEPASLFCQKTNGHKGNEPEDLEKACMNYFKFAPLAKNSVKMLYESKPVAGEDGYFKLDGQIKKLELTRDDILLTSDKLELNLNNDFLISGNQFDFKCAKKNISTIDSDQLLQFCLHDFTIAPMSVVNVTNLDDNSSFSFFPEVVKLHSELLEFKTPALNIVMDGETTTLQGMKFSCFLDEHADATDVSAYVSGCLKKSHFAIGSLSSSSKDSGSEDIFEEELKNSKANKGTLQEIFMSVKDGKMYMTSKVKFLFKFNLTVEATSHFNETTKVLQIHVDRAKLPLGIRSVKLLMYFIRKMMASETVKVSGKDIFIQL